MPSLSSARRVSQSLDELDGRRLFLVAAVPLLALYLLTATWSYPGYNDAFTNSAVGWSIGTRGSIYLDEHTDLAGSNWPGWIVEAGDSVTGKYPPGTALLAAPAYALWPESAEVITAPADQFEEFWAEDRPAAVFPLHPMGPAAITSALSTALAMGLLALVFRSVGGTGTQAVAGAYLAGLGTAAWSVASDQLWQHGPAMLWLAVALVLAARNLLSSGFAFGLAILTRPPLALIAAATGAYASLRRRSMKPAVLVGSGAAAGLALVVAYNAWVFGGLSISGGYGSSFTDATLTSDGYDYVRNLFYAGFSARRGLFVFSPFLLVLIPGLRAAWRVAPEWVRGAAVGSVAYLLIQYKANNYSGGFGFATYRYPLEALVAAAPLLFLSYREWVSKRLPMMLMLAVMGVLAAVLQAVAAIKPDLLPT